MTISTDNLSYLESKYRDFDLLFQDNDNYSWDYLKILIRQCYILYAPHYANINPLFQTQSDPDSWLKNIFPEIKIPVHLMNQYNDYIHMLHSEFIDQKIAFDISHLTIKDQNIFLNSQKNTKEEDAEDILKKLMEYGAKK